MKPFSDFATVPELIASRAESLAGATAVTFDGSVCTFDELEQRSAQVHAWLGAAGIGPGDRVSILMRNSLEFLYAWLGIARAGAVAVPINTALIGETLAYIVEHSESSGLIADSDLLAAVESAGEFPELRWRVANGPAAAGAEPFAALLGSEGEAAGRPRLEGGTPMTIVYTSGTTGMPKGVVLPHQSYTNTGAYFAHHLGLTADDRLHTCLPLFHCNAQQCTFMPAMHLGAPVALNAKFSVSNFWRWINESQSTTANLLGTMLTLLAKVPESEHDADNSLRYIIAGPIPEQIYRPFEDRFALKLVEGYGLSETGTMACINPPDDMRAGTIGLPLEYTQLRIVDEDDAEVPPETPGEIVCRTHIEHSWMLGYHREPEKTAEAMRGGWFHTGDLGKQRKDGYFVFLDRLKDSIRRRGENISSFLVEKAILEHPAVLSCAVFGVPSELSEEDVKVVAVLRAGMEVHPSELVDWCAERMADFMVPRYVEFRDSLPLTETGRVHKFKLREEGVDWAWDREAAAGSTR
jgi:crotonobetaine/carnitine-CoA ligase